MKNILVAVDYSDVTGALVEQAKFLSKATGATITLLHVAEPEPEFVGFEPGPEVVRTAVARDLKAEHEKLANLKLELAQQAFPVEALQIQGPAAVKIVEEARKLNASLIILGSHGHGALYHLLLGSVTSEVLKKTGCPVLIVPAAKSSK